MVDASALAAFVLREEGWEGLASYLVRAESVDHVLKEVANAIWRARRKGYISLDDALRAYSILRSIVGTNVVLHPEAEYIEDALRIALEHGITVYDSLYIALALSRGGNLLTLDRAQANVAAKLGVRVVPQRWVP